LTSLICLRLGTGGGHRQSGNEPSGYVKRGNSLTTWEPVSFSRRTLFHGANKHGNVDWNISVAVGISSVLVLLFICYRQKPVTAVLNSVFFTSKKGLI